MTPFHTIPLAAQEPSGEVLALVLIAGASLFGLFLAGLTAFKLLYKKTSADLAFVRTGKGGTKVVVDGGAFVINFLHSIKWINLETLRLQVTRLARDALITKDKFRVDMTVEFYIHVQPKEEQILRASRSLGDRSLTPETVKVLVEPKLISALRTVAATKDMIELHQERQKFEDAVHEIAKPDLEKNGLTLEAVSIVHLDQTDKGVLDPNNVFDAVGLKLITDATERARKEKNEIQRNAEQAIKEKDVATDIAIKAKVAENERKNNEIKQQNDVQIKLQVVNAEKQKLDAEKDLELKTAMTFKETETFKAERAAETQRFKFEQEQAVKTREIEKDQAVQTAQIEKELRVKQADLARNTALVAKQREQQEAQIAMELAVERAKRDKEIGIIEKVREQEAAEAEKLATVAERERAEQNVLTVQKTAEAERERQVAVLQQKAVSEQQQIEKQIAADAAAYEVRKRAEADALAAEQQAQAIERLAIAKLKEAEAHAEGQRRLAEARNALSRTVIMQEVALKVVEKGPEIIRELMRPAEKISEIKILNVTGAGVGANGNGHGDGAGGGSLVSKVVGSMLEAGAAYPMFKELMKFANVDMEGRSPADLARKALETIQAAADAPAATPPPSAPTADVAEAIEPPAPAKSGKRAPKG
jgi:uncharacterized membrane protein YqiK